jgi:hypothetical protein
MSGWEDEPSLRASKAMNVDPFRVAGGTARDREDALFDFLAQQARAPAPGVWSRCAAASGKEDDVGFFALLLSNLIERAAPGSSSTLYGIATTLLGARLTPVHFAAWLRTAAVDVPRLAAHLDHALSIATR